MCHVCGDGVICCRVCVSCVCHVGEGKAGQDEKGEPAHRWVNMCEFLGDCCSGRLLPRSFPHHVAPAGGHGGGRLHTVSATEPRQGHGLSFSLSPCARAALRGGMVLRRHVEGGGRRARSRHRRRDHGAPQQAAAAAKHPGALPSPLLLSEFGCWAAAAVANDKGRVGEGAQRVCSGVR